MKVASVPISEMDASVVKKLAKRNHVSPARLKNKHVLFVADQRPITETMSPGYNARVIRTAIIVDEPVTLSVYGVGSAIKSPMDRDHQERGNTIALARALKD